MKFISYFNNYNINKICKKYKITNYIINENGSIDVNGDVNLAFRQLEKSPLKFNKISGHFVISWNYLHSLEGFPKYVGGDFIIDNNQITSLEGSPKYVGGDFNCQNNKITSLEGCPEHVRGGFYCTGNPIFKIVQPFIDSENINNLIELFNYYDIVQDMNVIYDRLEYFYSEINIELTDKILTNIERSGYKIIR